MKPLHVILVILIPALAVSTPSFTRWVKHRSAARRFHATLNAWQSADFKPITNEAQRAAVALEVVRNAKLTSNGDEAFSERTLQATVLRMLAAFSTADVGTYKAFRGLDLERQVQIRYTKAELDAYTNSMLPPARIRQMVHPYADVIERDGDNETPEGIHLLAWLYSTKAIFKGEDALYCNGHWIGVSVEATTLCETNIAPDEFLRQRPNCVVRSYVPDFVLALGGAEATEKRLLFSTLADVGGGFPAHPVAVSLRWHPASRRWLPIDFAAGASINGVQYVW